MSSEIIPTTEYAKSLEKKYENLKIPIYKLKEWFFTGSKVFFDCESSDKASCVREILAKPDFPAFRIYIVVRDFASNSYDLMDVNFRNLGGKETLEHFIERYHKQLETMSRLSLQGAGREYAECVGHGYEETMS